MAPKSAASSSSRDEMNYGRNAGVLAGWPGGVSPPNAKTTKIALFTGPAQASHSAAGRQRSNGTTEHYGINNTFPVVSRASSARCASATSRNGTSRSMRNFNAPDAIQSNTSFARPSSSSRVIV